MGKDDFKSEEYLIQREEEKNKKYFRQLQGFKQFYENQKNFLQALYKNKNRLENELIECTTKITIIEDDVKKMEEILNA